MRAAMDFDKLGQKLTPLLDHWMERNVFPMLRTRIDALSARLEELGCRRHLKSTRMQRQPVYEDAGQGLLAERNKTMHMLNELITERKLFQTKVWTDHELRLIPSEDLAKTAYDLCRALQVEFPSVGNFLSYWRGLTRGRRTRQEASR